MGGCLERKLGGCLERERERKHIERESVLKIKLSFFERGIEIITVTKVHV